MTPPSRQWSRQSVGILGLEAGKYGNPDSNPDKLSGNGLAAFPWRQVPPRISPRWRDGEHVNP